MSQDNFLNYWLRSERVQSAALNHNAALEKLFQKSGLIFPSRQLYIRAFKEEKILEIWATDHSQYTLIKTYKYTANSGNPGPKQCEGDLQIPEGFYQIANFNPESKFHLSFKINYPNPADSIRNKKEQNQGGDIYIHGGESTTGCIPIGDIAIAELYWLCVKSHAVNPDIPVHIFPCKMEVINLRNIYNKYPTQISFWNSIKPMYEHFQLHKTLNEFIDLDENGNYRLSNHID